MKKCLLFSFLITAIVACKTTPPKDVANEFVRAVYTGDAAKATSLATEKTKASAAAEQKGQTPSAPVEESFSLASLSETVSGNTAEVKNENIRLTLEKESGDWKVVASPEVVAAISNRDSDLKTLKLKWENLLKEFEARMQAAREYLEYKKGQGTPSVNLQNMDAVLKTITPPAANKEAILQYVQKQHVLDNLVDKALEPSFSATGADLSMTYFLRLSNANDRIKKSLEDYRAAAQKTPTATYPVFEP